MLSIEIQKGILNQRFQFFHFFIYNKFIIQQHKMKDILKIQVVPIKTLILERSWIGPNKDYVPNKNQQTRNIRNFLFLRMMNKNKTDKSMQEKSISPEVIKTEIEKIKRPVTSFDEHFQQKMTRSRTKYQTNQNPQNNSIKKVSNFQIEKQTLSANIQSNSLNFKNYFPLRKTKKNKDPKWHKYCLQKRMSKSESVSHESSNNNLSIQLKHKNEFIKIKSKVYTPQSCSRKSHSKNRHSQRLYQAIEISPWSMNNADRENMIQKQQYFTGQRKLD